MVDEEEVATEEKPKRLTGIVRYKIECCECGNVQKYNIDYDDPAEQSGPVICHTGKLGWMLVKHVIGIKPNHPNADKLVCDKCAYKLRWNRRG